MIKSRGHYFKYAFVKVKMKRIKSYSPQGTYLPEHKKSRVRKKHWKIERMTMNCKSNQYSGSKVFFLRLSLYDEGDIVFSAKPKKHGTFCISYKAANDIRNS